MARILKKPLREKAKIIQDIEKPKMYLLKKIMDNEKEHKKLRKISHRLIMVDRLKLMIRK